jgi:hypothetical protein
VVETVTLVSSSEDSTKVAAEKPVEGSGSVEEMNLVDCSRSDKKASAAAAVNITAESSHTTSEKIHAASEKQSSSIIRQEGIEKVGTLFCVSQCLLVCCTLPAKEICKIFVFYLNVHRNELVFICVFTVLYI